MKENFKDSVDSLHDAMCQIAALEMLVVPALNSSFGAEVIIGIESMFEDIVKKIELGLDSIEESFKARA